MDNNKNIDTVLLDVRGEFIKVSVSVLSNSSYFREKFEQNRNKSDLSYFVDCDLDGFRELLSIMEFGVPKTRKFNRQYLEKISVKFGVNTTKIQEEKSKQPISREEQFKRKLPQYQVNI